MPDLDDAAGAGWFEHISESIEELRDELRRMERASMTPEDFGLRVKTHPDTLIVTARNKMGTGQKVPVHVGLSNKFIETYALRRGIEDVNHNRRAALDLVEQLVVERGDGRPNQDRGPYRLWTDVPGAKIEEFIRRFRNDERALQTQSEAVANFIHEGLTSELASWDVAVVGKANLGGRSDDDFDVICQDRAVGQGSKGRPFILVGDKNRVSSRGVERIGVPDHVRAAAVDAFRSEEGRSEGDNPPDRIYRQHRVRPLLLIQPLNLKEEDRELPGPPLVAWGISFPETTFAYRTATYVVNSTWWQEYMGEGDEGDDDDLVNDAV